VWEDADRPLAGVGLARQPKAVVALDGARHAAARDPVVVHDQDGDRVIGVTYHEPTTSLLLSPAPPGEGRDGHLLCRGVVVMLVDR
jgi:hypothetical protein